MLLLGMTVVFLFNSPDRILSAPLHGELISSTRRDYCTVYMINPHHDITSGHCVYNTTSKEYFTDLYRCHHWKELHPIRGVHADVLKVSMNTVYKLNGNRCYDYALLLLNSCQIESNCYLHLTYQKPPPTFTAFVCGYPYDK